MMNLIQIFIIERDKRIGEKVGTRDVEVASASAFKMSLPYSSDKPPRGLLKFKSQFAILLPLKAPLSSTFTKNSML